MFSLQHIYKSHKDRPILRDVSLAVNAGDVIALIGENGAGKTTLLNIVLGAIKADSGTVALHNETVGYVPQEAPSLPTIKDGFDQHIEDWKIDYALSLVGLNGISSSLPVASLSGGQKTRLAFAQILAAEPEPSVLLLDEPTNNLDGDSLAWLKNFIKDFQGGIILVSHDRAFINDVATGIAELHNGMLKQYGGNYDMYKLQKETEYQTELLAYQNNIHERARLEKAVRAQSDRSQHVHKHIKRSDNDKAQRDFFRNRVATKLGQNGKTLKSRLEQLGNIERPESSKSHPFTISGSVPSAKLLLQITDVCKQYGAKTLRYPDFEIRGAEIVHLRGANASGKTTLMQIIAGLTTYDAGTVTLGQNIRRGYMSQDMNGLDYDISVIDNLKSTGADTTTIYREAHSLGLSDVDIKRGPSELSRGQQAKLGFAKLLLTQNQILILDEPTNHLDIPTREKIEAALKGYKGAMLIASHDEYFLQHIGTHCTINVDKDNT